MPLAHTPCWPRPRVELLSSRPISAAEASEGLKTFLATEFPKFGASETDASSINVRAVPEMSRSLEEDWVTGEEPGADECFVEVYARLEVHMPPCFLGPNLDVGLRKAMTPLLLRHQPDLKCLPLTFTDLKPCGGMGATISVSPYVHFLAEFRDKDNSSWYDKDGKCLMKDQRVWFVISRVTFNDVHTNLEGTWEYDANMLGVVAVTASDGTQTARPKKGKSAAAVEHVAVAEIESEPAKPKKKKRKEREAAEAAESAATAEIESAAAKPKKRKRKEQETAEAVLVEAPSEGKKKGKKKT